MERHDRGYWIRVLWRGRVLTERAVPADATLHLGESNAADLVLPGLGTCQTLLDRGRLRSVVGLRVSAGADGSIVRGQIAAHPDVEIEVRREHRPPPPGPDLRAHVPWRELLYGSSAAVCLLTFMAIQRPAVAIESAGMDVPTSSPVARFMYTGPGPRARPTAAAVVAASSPMIDARPEPVPDIVEPEPVAPVVEEPPPEATVEAVPAVEVAPRRAPAREPPSESGGGRHSHSAVGVEWSEGTADGVAAVSERTCDDRAVHRKSQVDVVFVLDVSTTMGFVVGSLADEIEAVDRAVRHHDTSPRYGLVVFVDDVMMARGRDAFTSVDALKAEFRHWADFASSNRQLRASAQNVDWPENSLDALHAAATRFAWRPAEDTLRLVVHATDDGFGTPGQRLSGLPVRHGYGETVRALQEREIRVATFAARIGGQCECEDVRPGLLRSFRGHPSIPSATGGAAFDIDDVASGRLRFASAIAPLARDAVCENYDVPWR